MTKGNTVEQTLNERGKRYGEFKTHAEISQALKDVMRATEGWEGLSAAQKEALEMSQHKIARILNGDPNYSDNWHDIAGYSSLVEEIINQNDEKSIDNALINHGEQQ